MTLFSLSLNHRTAPLTTLAAVSLDRDATTKMCHVLSASEHVSEVAVLSTCNRVEVYADVDRFHAGLDEVVGTLSQVSGVPVAELQASCAVHFDAGTVSHAFQVASGLDSMVVGERQVVGQFRRALAVGQSAGTVGTALNSLFQQGIRVAKRVHTETEVGRAGRSLVDAAHEIVVGLLGSEGVAPLAGQGDRSYRGSEGVAPLAGRRVLVAGAGQMAGAAARTAAADGAQVTVVNRTLARAERLAAELPDGHFRPWRELSAALLEADVVICCTGAAGYLIGPQDFLSEGDDPLGPPIRATTLTSEGDDPLGPPIRAMNRDTADVRVVVDLAMPPDVDPAVASLPGIELVDLVRLQQSEGVVAATTDVRAAHELVAEEVTGFLAGRHARSVTPTVVALRSMASEVVSAELARLEARLPDLDDATRDEVRQTLHRVTSKLLHAPTVRVQQYAADSDTDYAAALRTLFALDPQAVQAVLGPEVGS